MKNTTATKTVTKKKKIKIRWRALMPWFIIAGVLLAVLAGAALYTAIQNDMFRKVYTVEYDGNVGSYYEPEHKITYQPLPFCYEAVLNASTEYPYAQPKKLKDTAKEFHTLYQVGYRDAEDKVHLKSGTEWLCRSKNFGGQVYYNPDKVGTLDFADFDWNVIYFTNPDSSQFSTYTLDAEKTDKLMRQFVHENAENVYDKLYNSGTLDLKLTLKVSSNTYTWLYLNLNLVEDTDGNYYLFPEGSSNAEDCRMVQVDNVYFEDYLKTLEEILGGTEE